MSASTDASPGGGRDRLAAHERLSTGALARWTRACATHPWRVVVSWIGIIAVLIVLVATDRRRAARRVRDPGLRHAEGDRPDRVGVRVRAGRGAEHRLRRARRASASTRRSARRRSRRRSPSSRRRSSSRRTARPGSRASATRSARTRSPRTGASPTPRRSSTRRSRTPTATQVVAVEDSVREAVKPAGVTVEYNGEAEFPPIEQGTSEALGLLAAIIVLLDRLPHVRRDAHPDRARDHGARDGVPAAVHPRRA